MKKTIWISVIALLLALSAVLFTGCTGGKDDIDDSGDDETSGSASSSSSIKKAEKMISEGDIEGAYKLLSGLKNNKKAEEMLANFRFVIESAKSAGNYSAEIQYTDDYKTADVTVSDGVKIHFAVNEKGLMTEEIIENGTQSKNVAEFDENGRQIGNVYYENGVKKFVYEYAYNEKGDQTLFKRTSVSDGNVETRTYEFGYDKDGNMMFSIWRSDSDRGIIVYDAKDDNTMRSTSLSSNGNESITDYVLDKNGNILSEHNKNGKSEYSYEYTYDEENRPIKTVYAGESFKYIFEYVYDEYGNQVKERYDYGNSVYEVEFVYKMIYSEIDFSNLTDEMIYIIVD